MERGNILNTDQDFGHITAHSFTNGDNRASFLEDTVPHILYLWQSWSTKMRPIWAWKWTSLVQKLQPAFI
jgi:hypothetical protein